MPYCQPLDPKFVDRDSNCHFDYQTLSKLGMLNIKTLLSVKGDKAMRYWPGRVIVSAAPGGQPAQRQAGTWTSLEKMARKPQCAVQARCARNQFWGVWSKAVHRQVLAGGGASLSNHGGRKLADDCC